MLSRSDTAVCELAMGAAERLGLGRAGCLLAVAQWWAESRCGMRRPFLLPDGRPSFNLGAVTAKPGIPWFGGGDVDAAGRPISQRWAKFPDMDAAARYWLSFGSVRAGLPALQAGDELGFSRALYRGGYYTGAPPAGTSAEDWTAEHRIAAYASMLRNYRATLRESLAAHAGSGVVLAAGLVAVVAGAPWLLRVGREVIG